MKQLTVLKTKDFENQSVTMAFIQVYKRLNDRGKRNLIKYIEDCSQFSCYQIGYDSSLDDKEERILKSNIILERIEEQIANKRCKKNVDNYKELFDILDHQPIEAIFTDEVKAIRDKYLLDKQFVCFVHNLYQWGYINGKRSERERRKLKDGVING